MKRHARLFETLIYLGFAGLMAFLVAWVLRPQTVASARQVSVPRSSKEAARLRDYFALPVSQPALVEFMDFQCPPCRATWPRIEELRKRFPNVAYRPVNFPLEMHPFAFGAAVAAEIARDKGQFDAVFVDLISGGSDLDVKSLNAYLVKRHLDPYVGKPESKPFQEKVRGEQKLGEELHVGGTPTFFVLLPDGSMTEVHSFDAIAQLLG